MQIGMVGLGRMRANMARRWRRHGRTVIGYARTAATVEGLVDEGAIDEGATSLVELGRCWSVAASWLLTAQAIVTSPDLADFGGVAADSGEGRWTSIAAIETGTPTPVRSTALYSRFTSRGEEEFGNRVLSAMRWGFGGHVELETGDR